jgi:conjugative transfer pilus assembly protein TraH
MMKSTKLTATLIIASLILASPAQANMQNALNSMFSANVTNPGAYSSAQRSGFVGGGIALRTPIKPINLMAFDPPRISAGCGGVDMYGGSFSFINAAQFTQLLRNIMNNALGLLFKAALKAIDPGISDLLAEFSKTVNDLNSLASNTCAIANQAISSIKAGTLETELTQAATQVGTSLGQVGKAFDSLHWPSITQAKSDTKAVEPQNATAGNFTWKALNRKNVANSIGDVSMLIDPADTGGNKSKLFMMSLIGTEINTSLITETTIPSKHTYFGPKFGLMDLIDADSVENYGCSGEVASGDADAFGPNSCVIVDATITKFEFAGSLSYVRNMLYGDSNQTTSDGIKAAVAANTPDAPGVNSIYYKLFNCTTKGCVLTPKESAFLGMAGPIFKFIKETQYDHHQVVLLSKYIEEPLSVMIVEKIGEATIRAAKTAWNGTDVKMPDSVSRNIASLDIQLVAIRQLSATYQDSLQKANIIAETARKNFPAL